MGTYTLSSQKKATKSGSAKLAAFKSGTSSSSSSSSGSGSAKLAAFKEATSGSSSTSTPTIKVQTEEERQANMLITSTQERLEGINRTAEALASSSASKSSIEKLAEELGAQKVSIETLKDAGVTQTQIDKLKSGNLSQLLNVKVIETKKASDIPAQFTSLTGVTQNVANQKVAYDNYVKIGNALNKQENIINSQQSTLNTTYGKIKMMENDYVRGDTWIGSQESYNQYNNLISNYNKQYNTYSTSVSNYNKNIVNYNENVKLYDEIENKKTSVRVLKKYTELNEKVSAKLPSEAQVRPYLEKALSSPALGGIPTAYTILNNNESTRKYAEQILDFNLGAYGAIKEKPLKSAATLATFFIGGVAIKGVGTAAKALGAGANTARFAKAIELGLAGWYVTDVGKRYVSAETARDYGFVTGDVIFNEVLPAGLGLKFGMKVASNIPKNAKFVKMQGGKLKTGLKEFAKSDVGEVKLGGTRTKNNINDIENVIKTGDKTAESLARSKTTQTKAAQEASAKAKAREDTLARQVSEQFKNQRTTDKTLKDLNDLSSGDGIKFEQPTTPKKPSGDFGGKRGGTTVAEKVKTDTLNDIQRIIKQSERIDAQKAAEKAAKDTAKLKESVARSKAKAAEEAKPKPKQETLAQEQARKFREQKAKEDLNKLDDVIKEPVAEPKAKPKPEPTVINITRKSENLINKAIRLQQKLESGQISRSTYESQKANILKQAKEISDLKKGFDTAPERKAGDKAFKQIESSIKSLENAEKRTFGEVLRGYARDLSDVVKVDAKASRKQVKSVLKEVTKKTNGKSTAKVSGITAPLALENIISNEMEKQVAKSKITAKPNSKIKPKTKGLVKPVVKPKIKTPSSTTLKTKTTIPKEEVVEIEKIKQVEERATRDIFDLAEIIEMPPVIPPVIPRVKKSSTKRNKVITKTTKSRIKTININDIARLL